MLMVVMIDNDTNDDDDSADISDNDGNADIIGKGQIVAHACHDCSVG